MAASSVSAISLIRTSFCFSAQVFGAGLTMVTGDESEGIVRGQVIQEFIKELNIALFLLATLNCVFSVVRLRKKFQFLLLCDQ